MDDLTGDLAHHQVPPERLERIVVILLEEVKLIQVEFARVTHARQCFECMCVGPVRLTLAVKEECPVSAAPTDYCVVDTNHRRSSYGRREVHSDCPSFGRIVEQLELLPTSLAEPAVRKHELVREPVGPQLLAAT